MRDRGISVHVLIVETSRESSGRKRKGGGHWKHWHRDLRRLMAEQTGREARFTTMFDLYGLPDDFPELDRWQDDRDTVRRADRLEQAMARAFDDFRLVPYIQRHEFEALVLASLDALESLLDAEADRAGIPALRAAVEASSPEEINDGSDSAPSKRLRLAVPSYRKTLHGPLAIQATGLAELRKRCPRFATWVAKLEALGT